MNNDDKRTLEERIAAAARDLYNSPPATPREEMWRTIEARLGDAVDDAAGDAGAGYSAGNARGRSTRRLGWWIGIAAALVVGLGIGRLSMRTEPAGVRVASEPATETTAETDVVRGSESESEEAIGGTPDGDGESRDVLAEAADGAEDAAGAAPATAADRFEPGDVRDGAGDRPARQYAATTRRLLDRGESFLTAVQADLGSGAPDPEAEAWARSLLSRTRVLMASPAAREPETRRLLEDLELMLAQIVVTTATGDPGEARILGEGLEDANLLYRLRSAMEEDSGPGGFRTPRTSSL